MLSVRTPFVLEELHDLPVVSEKFCQASPVNLVLKERVLCCSRDEFSILDLATKQPRFKLQARPFRGRNSTRKFVDAHGNVLARVKLHPVRAPKRLVVSGSGFSFEVRNPSQSPLSVR